MLIHLLLLHLFRQIVVLYTGVSGGSLDRWVGILLVLHLLFLLLIELVFEVVLVMRPGHWCLWNVAEILLL